MSVAQGVFLTGLSVAVLAIVGFSVVVLIVAHRRDGGQPPTIGLVGRMVRSPDDRAELNRWAAYLHRLSGFAIAAFLALHVVDVSLYAFSRHTYDDVHTLYSSAALRVLEAGLVIAILFHTFNGLRLLAIDAADIGIAGATRLLGAVAALTFVLGITAGWFVLGPAFT